VSEASCEPELPVQAVSGLPAREPFKNPSYPQRVHFPERPALEERLRSCEEQLRTAEQRLSGLGSHPQRATFERLYHRMLGARDQVAEMVRRLPLEAGALYDEDKERYEQAVQAFDRTWRQWDAAGG
jgi:hypothetical protein